MRSMDGHTQPKTSLKAPQTHPTRHVYPIFAALSTSNTPFSAPLAPFLPLVPPTVHLAPLTPSQAQKRREQPPQPPSPALYFHPVSIQAPPFQPPSPTFSVSQFNLLQPLTVQSSPRIKHSSKRNSTQIQPTSTFCTFRFLRLHLPNHL